MKNTYSTVTKGNFTKGNFIKGDITKERLTSGIISNGKIRLETGYLKAAQQTNLVSNLILEARKYYDEEKLEQASFLYQEALKLDPKNIETINGLGLIAIQSDMLLLAAEFFNMAWEINPDDLTTNKNLALVYTRSSRIDDAILHNICVLNIDENNRDAHSALARLNLQQGDLDLALHHYLYAFELNPHDPSNLQGLVQIDASVVSEKNISIIENILDDSSVSLPERCSYYFSLGKIYHTKGQHDKAFASYLAANISKCAKFDQQSHKNTITDLINTFSSPLFDWYKVDKKSKNKLNHTTQPVFVIGMPCSGISLVEKILSENAKVYSVGSLNQIQLALQKIGGMVDNELSHDVLHKISRYYLNEINTIAADNKHKNASRIMNTFSENYLQLGLIALLFPDAHIIHCVRDSFDTCQSSYFKNFAVGKEYSYDQTDITFYYQQYQRLMAHWKNVLPTTIHNVKYEDSLNSPATTSRELFEFIAISRGPVTDKSLKIEPCNDNVINASKETRQHYEQYFRTFVNGLSSPDATAEMGKRL